MKDVVHRHAASPLSRLRPGEQNNKVSQPPEACRRKLDHLYAISTSSPPLGGVFIVAYFCRQYNQELQLSPLKTAKSLPAARLFPQETSAANAVCLYAPPVKKGIPERPQTLRYPEIKNHSSAEYAQSATTTTAASEQRLPPAGGRCRIATKGGVQGGVVGAAARKTHVPPKARCGCWVPQPVRSSAHSKSLSYAAAGLRKIAIARL